MFLRVAGRVAAVVVILLGSIPAQTGTTVLCRWKDNKAGALSIMFDDSYTNHAEIAVPEMAKRGLIGTFFVNPGRPSYLACQQIWEEFSPRAGHELANHTLMHQGAKDSADADYQVGECARRIWATRPAGASKLQAFAGGGGTTWNITGTQYTEVMNRYHCVHRRGTLSCVSDNGIDHHRMMEEAYEVITTGGWNAPYMHTLSESGVGSMSIKQSEFMAFIDSMTTVLDQVWQEGWIRIHQYEQERSTADLTVNEAGATRIRLTLSCTKDTSLYKEPLTLRTQVPAAWDVVTVEQDGKTAWYVPGDDDIVMYDALPNGAPVTLTNVPSPLVTDSPADTTVYAGETVRMTVSAVSSGPLSFQWQKNGSNLAGKTGAVLECNPAADDSGASYRCIVTSGSRADTSDAARIHVNTWPLLHGLAWNAEDGVIDGPFTRRSYYLYHEPAFTAEQPEEGGRVTYFFTAPADGDYVVKAKVHAYLEGYRSLYVNIDAEPADDAMAWDIDLTSGFEYRTASWRGTGTVDTNEISPKVFSLTAGDHRLVIRGKDRKVKIDSVMVEAVSVGLADHADERVPARDITCRYSMDEGMFIIRTARNTAVPPVLRLYRQDGTFTEILCRGNGLEFTARPQGMTGIHFYRLEAEGVSVNGKCCIINPVH